MALSTMPSMRRLAYGIARAAGVASRRLGRGGGTSVPGAVLLRLRPNAIAELAGGLQDGAACISATNGKTTTARLLAECLEQDGTKVLANTAGANLGSGITTVLLARTDERFGLFEIDEAALPALADALRPRVIVLMNLFRDQLDRYGELETIADLWGNLVRDLPTETALVVNADDPGLAELGFGDREVLWFGVEDTRHALEDVPHAADARRCRRCGSGVVYDAPLLGHLGHWRCESCDLARARPVVAASRVDLDGVHGQDIVITTPHGEVRSRLALPGLHNAYNATAATAAAIALGIEPQVISPALSATAPAFGRAERVRLEAQDMLILLAKNPAGVNQNVRTLLLEDGPLDVMIGLNDRTADGQDVSWIWDVDYEPLIPRLRSLTLTGDRAYDLGLRFRYAGAADELIHTQPNLPLALDRATREAASGGTLFALPSYTAMLDLRQELVRRGVATEFWRDG